ncbi:MAG: trypsin-like peptidase domain-containing protein [Nostoc sp. NOS(2021)]|uniref:trypsin-like serine peptidase n=1 Tax=Nostoc sp. NOS(2021) TaxID=2815407 RepID=UPI002600F41D|nr:trypsin-like serine protease [Nostoc sp. NOS(2021)]MBN3895532.1 trypsin-like peptidase domain-containing protein [Nostoc sp. NOS(2021)]
MNRKFFALLLTGFLIFTTFSYWSSVQAETQVKPQQSITPKFISSQKLKLEGDGKPFIPPGLERGAKPDESDSRGIPTGIDNRTPMFSHKYPWSAIGRIKGTTDGGGYYCTGTLIAANLVLTNAHCVIDHETGKLSTKIQFLPNVIDGHYEDIAETKEVYYGTDFKESKDLSPNDWAILKINQPLGRKYGYLGTKSIASATLVRNQKAFYFVGYSGDFPNDNYQEYFSAGPGWTASYEAGCSIVGEKDGFLLHDCATAAGSSGSPIVGVIGGDPYIVALNNGEEKNLKTGQDIINYAVKISTIEEASRGN